MSFCHALWIVITESKLKKFSSTRKTHKHNSLCLCTEYQYLRSSSLLYLSETLVLFLLAKLRPSTFNFYVSFSFVFILFYFLHWFISYAHHCWWSPFLLLTFILFLSCSSVLFRLFACAFLLMFIWLIKLHKYSIDSFLKMLRLPYNRMTDNRILLQSFAPLCKWDKRKGKEYPFASQLSAPDGH